MSTYDQSNSTSRGYGPRNTPPAGGAQQRNAVQKIEGKHVPMDDYRERVVEQVRDNMNAVIIGETGSGKTTRIPEFLLEAFPNARIAITQPRRVAARSVSRYVAGRRGEAIGDTVGYQVRFEDMTTKGTRANFMTDGILLKKLSYDPLLTEYDIVMVDEAHERSLNIDFVLGLLKRVQAKRIERGMQELKVVVTSATIEKEKFATYFGDAPVVEVPGRMYPVDVQYEHRPVGDYAKAAAERVKQIVQDGGEGDVLIFMPGEDEIRRTVEAIEEQKLSGIDVLPLFGSMSPEDQDKIFQKNPKRKIIVSTNIAETSLTIDGVCFVIDSGLIKQTEFNPSTGIEALLTRCHARSGCEQRKGRAGRTAPGTCYRLYTAEEYLNRPPFQTPEILRSNLDHVILAMKEIGIDDVRTFDFIDKPTPEAIDGAIDTLKMLGALDENEQLTRMGETMARLPLRPELARMVIEAQKYHCTESITIIAAMFGGKSIFVRPKDKEKEADAAHRQFKQSGSDFLTMLEVWDQWAASGFNNYWAREQFLNTRALFEVREIRDQLMRELKRQDIAVEDQNATFENIQKSVAAGLIQHLLAPSGEYSYGRVASSGSAEIMIHPSSAAFEYRPRYMIGSEVVTTSRTFARKCQAVNPDWLPDIAPQILEVHATTMFYDAERDTVEELTEYVFKNAPHFGVVTGRQRKVTDEAEIRKAIARAMMKGQLSLPAIVQNGYIMEKLRELEKHSGGRVSPPDLAAFYTSKLGKAKNYREAVAMNDQLELKLDDYCSSTMRTEIDRLYPKFINVSGYRLPVAYEYRSANPRAYAQEVYTATITIPQEAIFLLNAKNFPVIGANGRPIVSYECRAAYSGTVTDTDLERVKAGVDQSRITEAWWQFVQPRTPVSLGASERIPSFPLSKYPPIPYAKDYRGQDVFAYPAFEAGQVYDSVRRGYVNQYTIGYFQTEEDARTTHQYAVDQHTREIFAEQERKNRAVLMEPARVQYEALHEVMSYLSFDTTRVSYGLSPEDVARLERTWSQVRQSYEGVNPEPQRVLDLIDDINRQLIEKRAEYHRRLAILDTAKNEMSALAFRVLKIDRYSYERYGLTYGQYRTIQTQWQEAKEALEVRGWYGAAVPDPEKALRLLEEIRAVLPLTMNEVPLPEPVIEAPKEMKKSPIASFDVLQAMINKDAQGKNTKASTPVTVEAPRAPVEREKMTEAVRADLVAVLSRTRVFFDTVRAVQEPKDKTMTNADKISKARVRAGEAKAALNALDVEILTMDDASSARGKVADIARRAEKVAEDMARFQGWREDWTEQFKQFMTRLESIAVVLDVPVDAALRDTVKTKITELAKRKGDVTDLDGRLETILVESL